MGTKRGKYAKLAYFVSIGCALLLSLTATRFLTAQTLNGLIGTVTDSSGATIEGASVTIRNNSTGVEKKVVTTSAGSYNVTDLNPGDYTVTVESTGFDSSVHQGVLVEVGRTATVDVILQPGSNKQTVTVTENPIALDTSAPTLNTTIENKVVQELPTALPGGRGRQIDSLIFLAPGVTGTSFSHRIGGGSDFQNEVVFNGIPMSQSETQGYQTIWNPPFDLVDEFNVLRSSFTAQYGLAQGVITYHTKSGTNQYHGNGFEIVRNNYFDARGAYNPTVPIDKENNYGFSLGGPVIIPKLYDGRNRTFAYVSMEWYRQNVTQTGNYSLPSAAEKAGDFSALADSNGKQIPIFDPAAGLPGACSANGNTPGTPFRGNIIPTTCFSPTSASLLKYLPDPTLSGFNNNAINQVGVLPVRQNPWGFTVDHNISDKQAIHWAMWRDRQTSFGGSGLASTNPLAFFTYFPNLGTVFLLNYSYTVTPHLVVTAGASWLGELNFQIPNRTGAQPTLFAAPGAPIVPGINFGGPLSPAGFGSSNTNSINRKLGTVIDTNVQYIQGRNTYDIGWEFRRSYQDDNECQQCAGNFNFSNNQTADPNNLSNTGNAFASYLLGTVDSANRTGSQELRLKNTDVSLYFQDATKITPKLTVNAGLRWDIMVPFTEKNNNIVFFNSTIPNPGADNRLGAASRFGNCAGCAGTDRADIKWKHFGPRAGFSYQLNNKTVVQAGGSISFLNGGAYEYGISKVAVNYGNLLLGSFTRPSLGSTVPGFGSWDTNFAPSPAQTPFTPSIGNATTINAFDTKNDGIAPYDALWSVSLQRELPKSTFFTLAYTGNRANHLPSQLNVINQISTAALSQYGSQLGQPFATVGPQLGIAAPYANFNRDFPNGSLLQALRPYPQYADIFNNFDMTGSSLYNALQLTAEKRYADGLGFLVSYSLSRSMSNTSSGFSSFAQRSIDKNNQKSEWSIDGADQTHVVKISGTYELPFGKGHRFLSTGRLTNAVVGGWQLSPILTYASGTPLGVGVAGNPLGAGGNRPNIVPGVNPQLDYSNAYKGLPVINAAAFSDPGPWALGNAKRILDTLRSPFNLNEDVALAKYFYFTETIKLKLEMEYFNALNRFQFGYPDTFLNDANFGRIINSQGNSPRRGQAHITLYF